MSAGGLNFARANLKKLLSLPTFALAWLLALVVPRTSARWLFGSGSGVGEGALAVARVLRQAHPEAHITWAVATDDEAQAAGAEGFLPVRRGSWAGFWSTLRAGQIVVTHGHGDANRFGVFGARVTHLIHGAPLKRLHLDSAVTTQFSGPIFVRALLQRMYLAGSKRIELFVAGSVLAAERLRTAYRVAPGRVRVLGDPRDDVLAAQATEPRLAAMARAEMREILGLPQEVAPEVRPEPMVLYAPTWRDGDPDPGVPTAEETASIHDLMERMGARLVLRPHPLGVGAYADVTGGRVHLLSADKVRDITPMLGAFDAIITDYSSIAVDYSLLARPIVWFAPDLEQYGRTRGLYEPLEVTSAGQLRRDWTGTLDRLAEVIEPGSRARRAAESDARALAKRFHAHPEGGAAERVLAEILRLGQPERERIPEGAVFFESYYGRQVSCNPLAIDREIARRHPEVPRYWSVISERIIPPPGAIPVLVGGADWFAVRRRARLLVVNDWLRHSFRRRRGQTVLQTWHGTMLKHLALGRPGVGLRTRLAIRRESSRWNLLLSQNPHSTAQFRSSYAYRGEILETGYPRDDRLANALAGAQRSPVRVETAKRLLGVPVGRRVLVYAPTWRDAGLTLVDELNVRALAVELGDDWVVVARGHTRTHGLGTYEGVDVGASGTLIDASTHPDVNDVILAADLLVTDYSSVMFDAAVARVPTVCFVPDLVQYRDRERGFTFDFASLAPGPLLTERDAVVAFARELAAGGVAAGWVCEYSETAERFRHTFVPHDDGGASGRVVDALEARGALPRP
ncbi:CDP-glycerol glycerophosphotransferase family protein [Leucobacter sp. W1478]|uniref:CDP-glycerol glycerophosphotransferase family protein n=1 Tax=Leucobacter sp. W1478 TaxID=3439065 RepID=UPI003F3516A2